MGKLSRTKGAAFECLIARWLTKLSGTKYRRVLVETQQGNVGDVASERGWLVVQCKVGKRPPIWKALAEAEEAAEKRSKERGFQRRAIACIHRDGGEKLVAMTPETFAWLTFPPLKEPHEGW